MAILKNGALADYKILYAGAELDRATHNGTVELWVKAIPYTVVFTDYPIVETESGYYATKNITTSETGYVLKVKRGEQYVEHSGYGFIQGEITLPTQKCNKVKIKYSTSEYCNGTINGSAISANVTDEYLILDCTGESFDLVARIWDATAYYDAVLTITEVSFYYESV